MIRTSRSTVVHPGFSELPLIDGKTDELVQNQEHTPISFTALLAFQLLRRQEL